MAFLLLALDRGRSACLLPDIPFVLGRGRALNLRNPELSRTHAVCTVTSNQPQACCTVTVGRRVWVVRQRTAALAAPEVVEAGATAVLHTGDRLYLLGRPALRYGYRLESLGSSTSSYNSNGGSAAAAVPVAAPWQPPAEAIATEAAIAAPLVPASVTAAAAAASKVATIPKAASRTQGTEQAGDGLPPPTYDNDGKSARARAAATAARAAEARAAAAAARGSATTAAAAAALKGQAEQAVEEPALQPAVPLTAPAAAAAVGQARDDDIIIDLMSDGEEEAVRPAKKAKLGGGLAVPPAAVLPPTAAAASKTKHASAGGGSSLSGSAGATAQATAAAAAIGRWPKRKGDTRDGEPHGSGVAAAAQSLILRMGGGGCSKGCTEVRRLPAPPNSSSNTAAGPSSGSMGGVTGASTGSGSVVSDPLQAPQRKAEQAQQLHMAQQLQLQYALDKPFAPHRISQAHLQPALAEVLHPHVPRPVDPATQDTWSLLTYNIWFDSVCVQERMGAIGRIIQENGCPDFVLLQETTHHFYLQLASQPWWRCYHASPLPEVPPWGPHYFTTLLWRKDSVRDAAYLEPHPFATSTMGRDIKSVRGWIGGTPVRVSNTHLESPMGSPGQTFWKERSQQMREMMGWLDAASDPNSVVGGDMNWIPMGSRVPPVQLPAGWCDVWLALRRGERGATFDSQSAPQRGRKYGPGARLDRVFGRLRDWEPALVEIVGRDPIPGLTRTVRTGTTERSEKEIPVWPSDHFGLFAMFVRKAGPAAG